MTKKDLLRSILFFLLVIAMLICMCDIFELDNTTNYNKRFYTYRNLPEDTVDAVWFGTSGTDRYWAASQAYEDYGITMYTLASDSMPAWLYTNMIEYAQTYQDPELFVIDIRAFTQMNTNAGKVEVRARRIIDSMDFFSPIRFKTAMKTAKMVHRVDSSNSKFDLSYLLSFIKYHTKWKDDDFLFADNIGDVDHRYAGFFVNAEHSVEVNKVEAAPYNFSSEKDLDAISEEALYDLLAYAEKHDVELLFIDTPQVRTEGEMARANRVFNILEEEGANYLHYYKEGDYPFTIDLDLNGDFYNNGHVNYYGALKFTDSFAQYVDNHYDLPDRRADEQAKEYWDGINETLIKQIKKYEKQSKK